MYNKNIVLIGMMGSGKTTVSRILAEKTGMAFLDTDHEIEKESGMMIREIFEEQGEQAFRALEKKKCEELSDRNGLIVATGGGIILNKENIENLRKHGVIVYLNGSVETLERNLISKAENRPLLDDTPLKVKISELLSFRADFYDEAADLIQDINNGTPEHIANEILQKVDDLINGTGVKL